MASQHTPSSASTNLVGVHYRVGKKIGEGSFGVIFEGECAFGRWVFAELTMNKYFCCMGDSGTDDHPKPRQIVLPINLRNPED